MTVCTICGDHLFEDANRLRANRDRWWARYQALQFNLKFASEWLQSSAAKFALDRDMGTADSKESGE